MTLRGLLTFGVVAGLVAALAGCAQAPVKPPPVVATLPPAPPTLPPGAYPGLDIPGKREDGTYVTPNFQMTDAAAVWHLRGALNVAALACDQAGGGVVDGYNAWIGAHREALDAYVKRYMHEWEETGWGDWQDAYDNNQTRLYNFYSQSPIRVAFCAAARAEIGNVGAITDANLPTYARQALARLDKPFIDFYTAFDAWRDYYQPKVTPPPVVATVPAAPAGPASAIAPAATAGTAPLAATSSASVASPVAGAAALTPAPNAADSIAPTPSPPPAPAETIPPPAATPSPNASSNPGTSSNPG